MEASRSGRLANGAGNIVRVTEGATTTDEMDQVYLAGLSASGRPHSFSPPKTGTCDGGAHLMVTSLDLGARLYVTRLDPGGHARAVDARAFGANPSVALVGASCDPTALPSETQGGARRPRGG